MEELEREDSKEKLMIPNGRHINEGDGGGSKETKDKMNENKFGNHCEGKVGESLSLSKAVLEPKQRPRLMSFEEAVAGETMARCLADLTHRNKHQAIINRGHQTPQQYGRSFSYTSNSSRFSNAHLQHRGRPSAPNLGSGRRMLTLTPTLERSSNSQEFVQEKRIFRQISEPAMLSCFVDDNGTQNLNRSRSNNTGFTTDVQNATVGGSCNAINRQRHSSPHPNRRLASSRCMSYSEQVNSINDNIHGTNSLNHSQSEPKLGDPPRLIVVDIPLESEESGSTRRAMQGDNSNLTEMNITTPDGMALNENCSQLIAGTDLKVRKGHTIHSSTNNPEIEDIWTRREDFVPPNGAIPSKVLDSNSLKTKCNLERGKVQVAQQGALSQEDQLDNAPPGGRMVSSRDNLICTTESGMNGMYHDEEEGGEIGVYDAMEHTTDSETCDSSSVDSRNDVMSIERAPYTMRGTNAECRSAPLLRKQVSFDLSLTFFDDDIVNGRPGQSPDSVGKSSPWFKRLRRPTRTRSEGRVDACSLDDVFEEPEESRPKSGTLPRNIGSSLFKDDTDIDVPQTTFNGGKPKSSTLPASYRALPQNKCSILQPDFFIRKNEKYPKPRKKDHGKVKIPKQRSHSEINPYSCDKREKRSSVIAEEDDICALTAPTSKKPFSGLRRMLSRESIQNKQGKVLRRRSKSESCMLLPMGNCKVCDSKVERGEEVAMPTEDIIHKRCFKCAK
ncbi:uncharacterized protein LOC129276389 isoform X2 [Lytechinus pictus]